MSIFPLLLGGLKAAILKILGAVLTEKMMVWVLMFFAELAVKSTKTPYDDKVYEKIKEALDAPGT